MLANKNRLSRMFLVILSCCLLLQGSLLTNAPTVKAEEKPSTLSIASGVTVSLYDAQTVVDETGNLAAFTIVFENNSNNTVNLIDYWARIKGSNNKSYVTKLISEDKDKKYVIPKTTTYLTYYAYVDEKEKLSDLKLDIIKWDFGANNYERVIGNVKTSSDGSTAYKQAEEINLNKTLVNVLISGYKMYTDNQYAYLSLDTTIRNKSNSSVDLSVLQFYLSDGKGSLIELETPKELGLKPQERKNFTLTGAVAKAFVNNNVSVVVMYKDEAAAMNIPKATFTLPKLSNTAVNKANTETIYSINGTSVAITMKDSVLSYTNKKASLETKLSLENKSNIKIAMPAFEFYIKTTQGYMYPLVLSETEEISLLPKIKKELTLQGEIPQDIKLATSEIVVFVKGSEDTQSNFLGNYKVSIGNSSEPTQNASRSATYQEMLIEQVSLQRTPNGVNDLLIAEFKVTNKGDKGKGKFAVAGQFELDGVKLSSESTTIVNLDRLVAVSPGQSYRIIAYTEIPYVQEADKIVFSMKEQAEAGLKDIHSFEVSSMSNAQLLASNQSYNIDTLGGRGEVSIVDSSIYNGKQSDLFVAKLQYVNKEKRATAATELKGYIENSKQDIIDLDIKNYETKLLPDGQAIIYVSAVIPKNYEDKKINLYFGEALTSASEEQLSKVVINPVYTPYVIQPKTPLNNFVDIPLTQYDVTLSNIQTQLGSSDDWILDTITLDFDYEVKVRDGAPAYSDVENIVIEFSETEVPSTVFSQSFAINNPEAENGFKLGKGKGKTITYTNELIQVKNFGTYDLNVYAEYKGHKKLIATKTLEFGSVN